MRILKFIYFLSFFTSIQAQVKTISLKKVAPYDTQHVTLSFATDIPIMPGFVNGKNNFDASVARAYSNIVKRAANQKTTQVQKIIRTNRSAKKRKRKQSADNNLAQCDSGYCEGKPLDKARFVNVKTYCDTDGRLIVLPQAINNDYDLIAIQIVKQLPKFKPAQYNGENVPVYLTIPIRFLNEVINGSTINLSENVTSSKKAFYAKHKCKLRRWLWRMRHRESTKSKF